MPEPLRLTVEHDRAFGGGVFAWQQVVELAGTEFDELVVGRWLHVEQLDVGVYTVHVGGVVVHVKADRDGRPVAVDVYGPGDYAPAVEGVKYGGTALGDREGDLLRQRYADLRAAVIRDGLPMLVARIETAELRTERDGCGRARHARPRRVGRPVTMCVVCSDPERPVEPGWLVDHRCWSRMAGEPEKGS